MGIKGDEEVEEVPKVEGALEGTAIVSKRFLMKYPDGSAQINSTSRLL